MNTKKLLGFVVVNNDYRSFVTAVAKKAKKEKAKFDILCIAGPYSESRQKLACEIATYTKSLGGNFIKKEAASKVNAVVDFLNANNNQYSVLFLQCHAAASNLLGVAGISLANQLNNELKENIKIIEIEQKRKYYTILNFILKNDDVSLINILVSIAITIFAFLIINYLYSSSFCIRCGINLSDMTPVLMVISFSMSAIFGMISGIASLLISVLMILYFFIEPSSSFLIFSFQEKIHLTFFIVCNIIGNFIFGYIKAKQILAHNNKKILRTLFNIYHSSTKEVDSSKVLLNFYSEVTALLDIKLDFYMILNDQKVESVFQQDSTISSEALKSIRKCYKAAKNIEVSQSDITRFYIPIHVNGNKYGVLELYVSTILSYNESYMLLIYSVKDLLSDLIERSVIIDSMQKQQLSLEQEKLRSLLLTSVSHNFKTPLSSILGSLSQYRRMQKKGTLNNDISDQLINIAIDESQRLSKFITNILNSTQLENNIIKLKYRWVDIYNLILETTANFKKRSNIQIVFDEKLEKQKYYINADSTLLDAAIQNIIENSIKYSCSDKVKIYISSSENDQGIFLYFEDNGNGVEESQLERIFDQHKRIERADSKTAGTGLGLNIVKQIMLKHGGSAHAKNSNNGGLIICLYFKEYKINE